MQRFLPLAVLLPLLVATSSAAQTGGATTRLRAFEEVPAISSTGRGLFEAHVDENELSYTLTYPRLQGQVTQAHIHIAQKDVNGGIMIWLCSNLPSPPTPAAGVQACPQAPGTISGTVDASDVVGPTAQGIDPGEFAEVLRAIRTGITYVNVHTNLFPGGEIRGQLTFTPDDE